MTRINGNISPSHGRAVAQDEFEELKTATASFGTFEQVAKNLAHSSLTKKIQPPKIQFSESLKSGGSQFHKHALTNMSALREMSGTQIVDELHHLLKDISSDPSFESDLAAQRGAKEISAFLNQVHFFELMRRNLS